MKTRFLRVAAALALCAIGMYLGRDGIASMLVQRGDEFVQARQVGDAQVYYGRALLVSPQNAVAAAKYVSAADHVSDVDRNGAIAFATRFLERDPDATIVRRARALAYTSNRQWALASADWRIVTAQADPQNGRAQDAYFAAMTALRAGERSDALSYVPIVAQTNQQLAAILRARLGP